MSEVPPSDSRDGPDPLSMFLQFLRMQHLRSAKEPIQGPNQVGAFPDAPSRSRVLPVVADANVLSRDILRACRQSEHTVLVNAVNVGMMRLYCAPHVLSEVEEHGEEWCAGAGVPRNTFFQIWRTKYLPILRVVTPEEDLLAADEQRRIDLLDHGPPEFWDPDDVPSATLALQLGAFFLSMDRKPLRAVYGHDADLTRHHEWLAAIKCGGDISLAVQIGESAAMVPVLVVGGTFEALKWVWERVHPLVALAIVGVGGYAVTRLKPETRRHIGTIVDNSLTALLQISQWYEATRATFQGTVPSVPSWTDLAHSVSPEALLTRVIMNELARSPGSHRSARELAGALPFLPVSQGEAKVRAVLRSRRCFQKVYDGYWQLGRAAILTIE